MYVSADKWRRMPLYQKVLLPLAPSLGLLLSRLPILQPFTPYILAVIVTAIVVAIIVYLFWTHDERQNVHAGIAQRKLLEPEADPAHRIVLEDKPR